MLRIFAPPSAQSTGGCVVQLVERVQVALLHEVGKRLLVGIQADEGEDDWMSRTVNAADLR